MAPKRKQPTWRTPLALSAFVLAAWAWDTALGHGGASPWGWLGALVLVGGISSLAVHSAKLHPLPVVEPDAASVVPAARPAPDLEIRVAEEADLAVLADVERAADTLFAVAGIGTFPDDSYDEDRSAAALLLVAGRPVVGFVWVDVHDGEPHVHELAVVPSAMKKGLGSAFLERACQWARDQGFTSITLTTFADVPWNGPYYQRRGFVELQPDELTPALRRLRDAEIAQGNDRMGRRIAMRKSLGEIAG